MKHKFPPSVSSLLLPSLGDHAPPMMLGDLSALSREEILRGLQAVIFDTRKLLVRLLFFLAEVERRALHAELGFSTLHDFCMRYLGMSLDSAHRRVHATRVGLRFPLAF